MKIFRKLFLAIVLLFGSAMISRIVAQTIEGRVSDPFLQPLSFVSVYLKSNPQVGSSTGLDGGYKINLTEETSAKNDVLVFSFIGYKTVEKGIRELLEGGQTNIQLTEQPILLDGTAITGKISRKKEKEIKLHFFNKFKEQLEKDFPDINREYRVVSSVRISKPSEEPLVFSELKGTICELPRRGRGGKDSLLLIKESIQGYTHQQLLEGLKKMGEKWKTDSIARATKVIEADARTIAKGKTLKNKSSKKDSKAQSQNKQSLGSTIANLDSSEKEIKERSLILHEGLWGWNSNVRLLAKSLDYDPKNWNISYSDDYTVLSYRYKKGFLGIVRMETQIHFILDSYTYSVEKIAESIVAEVNIPIGYKLKGEMLDALNLANVGEAEITKYRVRHIDIAAQRNVIYRNSNYGKVVDEKSMDADFSIEDTKGRLLKHSARAMVKVVAWDKI